MTQEPHGAKYFPVPLGNDVRGQTRASTADREEANAILAAAMSVGALSPEEFTERAGTALAAVTLAELDALCADLPMDRLGGAVVSGRLDETSVSTSGAAPVTRVSGILSGGSIGGGAVVAGHLTAFSLMGGVEIDLRDVEFTAPVLTIACRAIMGGIRIVVPEDVTVEVHGTGIMGGFSGRGAGAGRPGAPRVIVTGFALMGGVDTERAPRGQNLGPRRPN
ncbi:DUF1707 domain-containing protein [Gordonia alkaliphila]|uniref:DUF1707 SHOCT-like domain-containing protein n=1 Tax=Gordonia alkaliphila TaxID=1053547 RepID=UPI001FF62997|nr:DUF1707 domain-containing protein [Gordonia alkaliphila]MCK0439700.1 DUF1707 domain-containing protein [Gordonia alkaliphila]